MGGGLGAFGDWREERWVPLVEHTNNYKEPGELLFQYLLAAGGHIMTVDGGTTPVKFKYTVPVGKKLDLVRVNTVIVDGGALVLEFGGITALTNGILIQAVDTNGTTVLNHFGTDLRPIKANYYWNFLAGIDAPIAVAVGDDMIPIRWTIAKAGAPLRLTAGQIFQYVIRDDIRALTDMSAMIQGVLTDA